MAAGILSLHHSPVMAFGHDKLKESLEQLTQPPPQQAPATQPAQATPTPAPAPSQRPAPKRSITNIAGNVYQFKNNFHNSVLMVTPDGIIFVDPINNDASTWLKAEVKRRFNQTVKYVVYSHDHADHISGGEVFADTAIFVAHERAKRDIIDEKRATPVPDITFTDKLTLELGGKVVNLNYVGRNHSDNSIVISFPAERVLHAVDFIPVKSVAFRDLPDSFIDEWVDSLKTVEAMDFDILSPGHGGLGTKSDVRAFRGYFEEMRSAVTEMARAGKSADEVVAAVTMDKYKSWGGYGSFIKANVRAMYERVQANRRGN
ncbi:MAG: MBL fold metallo-hydrolase [Proteobacteria bacterium]|nr:MBL fold metallo-hydrolase [Pseudomonadota bacterium]